ncbi:MAG TPA: hypothetical protein VN628_13035 [Vicinamibacterales bacterium]|nr:hypothetical protein [Vicinamibacterales bacterium]
MIQKVLTRLGVLMIAIAVVLVPTIARAHQRVEHRDATRLSVKHSWIGVAPPTKAIVAQQQIVVAAAVAVQPEPRRLFSRTAVAPAPALHRVLDRSSDPLRGPPSPASLG